MATVVELFDGRVDVVGESGYSEIPYLVSDAADEGAVAAAILASVPGTITTPHAVTLIFSAMELQKRESIDTWRVSVRYKLPEPYEEETPDTVYNYDSTGGTQHITQSLDTVAAYGDDSDYEGAIGFDGQNVAGVDIVIPQWNWSETHYIADVSFNAATFYALTGKVNSDVFQGYEAGEVLFRGITARKRGEDNKWEVTLNFSASLNRTGITVGSISGIAKKGWEYMWVEYQDAIDALSNTRIKKPKAVYVEKVYEIASFAALVL